MRETLSRLELDITVSERDILHGIALGEQAAEPVERRLPAPHLLLDEARFGRLSLKVSTFGDRMESRTRYRSAIARRQPSLDSFVLTSSRYGGTG